MSLWEFSACVDGWNKAQSGNKPLPPTEEEFDAVLARFDQRFGTTMH